ncbi:hypothetical protein LY78DRAFT_669666 [Colletotrichum sublineola]|nr:hypothetical protein LY78DRAFT_669666 [Colletotrichum sublineola]
MVSATKVPSCAFFERVLLVVVGRGGFTFRAWSPARFGISGAAASDDCDLEIPNLDSWEACKDDTVGAVDFDVRPAPKKLLISRLPCAPAAWAVLPDFRAMADGGSLKIEWKA